jgi:prepilin-type N-terminal cleavage/methylation domain-containing protein
MKRSAFTLIELLVVMAIVALLASLIIAAVNNGMEAAQGAKDLANLREVGKGVMVYLNDNNDDFFSKGGTGGATKAWPEILHDNYKITWKTMRSPFDKPNAQRPDKESGGNIPISYGMNPECFDSNTGKWTGPGSLLIGAPALEPGKEIKFRGTSSQNVELNRPTGGEKAKNGTHKGRTRIAALFGDGRVESLNAGDFSTTSGPEGGRRWDPFYKQQQ